MSSFSVDTEELLKHAGWLRGLARELVRDAHRAEDLTQETLVAALHHAPARSSNLRAWLAAVLRNAANMAARSERRRASREQRAARGEATPSAAALVGRLSMHRQLVEAVQDLPEPLRGTVLLRFFEEWSLRRIAAEHGVPVSTVNSRLRRALERLRAKLDERAHGRRAWVTALAPLLPRRGGVGAAVPIAVKLAAAAAAVAAVAWLGVEGLRARGGAPAEPVIADHASAAEARRSDQVARTPAPPVPRRELAAAAAPGDPGVLRGLALDAGGSALAGVTVGMVPAAAEDRFPRARLDEIGAVTTADDRRSQATARALTGADGRFEVRFDGNDGRIVVVDDGWATVLAGIAWRDLDAEPVVVAARTSAVDGRVLGPGSSPIADAAVALELPASFRSRFRAPLDHSVVVGWEADTDADGRFELPLAPDVAGSRIVVRRHGYEPRQLPLGLARRGLEVRLDPVETGVAGTVETSDGAAVAGAVVVLDGEVRTETDAVGAFRFAEREAPPARVTAVAPGHLPATVELAPGEKAGSLRLVLGGRPLAIRGRVVDAGGAPVPGSWVWVTDPTLLAHEDDRSWLAEAVMADAIPWPIAIADRTGAFALEGLLPKEYRLRCSRPGSCRFGETGAVAAGSCDVRLRYPNDEVIARVAGRARDRSGRPLAGVRVIASRAALTVPSSTGRGSTWFANGPATVTDSTGAFELRDVPAAAGLFVNGPEVFQRTTEAGTFANPEAVEITVALECHLQVEHGATLGGAGAVSDLAFEVRDAKDRPVEIRLPLGIATRPLRRCPIESGRSPVVVVPDDARQVVLLERGEEVDRAPITPSPDGVTRMTF